MDQVTRSMTRQELEVIFQNRLQFASRLDHEEEWISLMLWCKWKGGGRHSAMGFDTDNRWCWDQIPEEIRKMLMPSVKEIVINLPHEVREEIS